MKLVKISLLSHFTFLSFLNHETEASGLPPVDRQDSLYTFPD